MKLIDNRFKVNKLLKDNTYSSIYEAIDFWDSDRKFCLKIYNTEKQTKVIEYFINNFIDFSRIEHKNLLNNKHFSIIKAIDGKKVNINQYYSTTEFIDAPCLDDIYMNLSLSEKLNIIIQVCTVLDFLHFRGIVYKHLSPTNIFVLENNSIKLNDLASVYESFINVDYDNLTRFFIAPEVVLKQDNNITPNSDKYSLGKLMAYLLTDNFYKDDLSSYIYKEASKMTDEQIAFLNEVITNLTNKNFHLRDINLRYLTDKITKMFNIDYKYDLVKERGVLNFETKIIGRENEIKKILKIDRDLAKSQGYIKMLLVNGSKGVGKTKFLKEMAYLLRMKGREVYNIEITPNNCIELTPITNILRQTIKDTPKNIVEKYGREFIGIMPEIKFMIDNKILNESNINGNRFRLYDRITNYFEDLTKYKDDFIYLIIDNIDEASTDFLYLIDYLVRNISYGKLILIVSYNEKAISSNSNKCNIITGWLKENYVENVILSDLNIDEIAEFIQNILGIDHKPLEFAAVILKECRGNPKYIEYMMKDLYAKGELFFNKDGFWELKAQRYSDIYFPSSLDEALKNQLAIIEKKYMDVMKVVSIYQSSISKAVLSKIVDLSEDELNNELQELISMRLIDEVVSDWGFSYSINNVELKRLIYYRIPLDERTELHRKISQVLEESYKGDYEIIMEELLYHLVHSDQTEKALDILIKEATAEHSIYSTRSLFLWEEAYELSKNSDTMYKINILEALGNIYLMRGEFDKGLKIYEELYYESIKVNKLEYSAVAKLGIGEILLQRGQLKLASERAIEAFKISDSIGDTIGVIKSKILYCKVLLDNNKLDELELKLKDLIDYSSKNKFYDAFGDIYNLIGLCEYFRGNLESAIENYKISVKYFNESNEFVNSSKPLNNIANIYSDSGEYEKAMRYLEDAINIVDKYGLLKLKVVFLNNIGEVYMHICNFDKAQDYFEEARNIAIDVGDINGEFLANVNLGIVYLLTNRYDKAYGCFTILVKEYSKCENIRFDILCQYYDFLGEFYATFGKWKEAKEWSLKGMEMSKEYNISLYLMSKARLAFINCIHKRKFDKGVFEEIRNEFRSKDLKYYRRRYLLNLAVISLIEGDYGYVEDILNEDNELSQNYPSIGLDYSRKLILYAIKDDENSYIELIKLEENMKKHGLLDIDALCNFVLGSKAYERGDYYQSFNYLLESLDLVYILIKNVPDMDFQISFIRKKRTDEIKEKLAKVINNVFGEKLYWMKIEELNPAEAIDKYFDYSSLLKSMDDDQFEKLIQSNFTYSELKDILNVPDLINNLKDNPRYNLELLLKYLTRETLAENGYILIHDETKNEFIPVVGLGNVDNFKPNQNLLDLANRYDGGILLSASFESNVIGLYKELLPKNTKALICVPIRIANKDIDISLERRKGFDFSAQKNLGYIYLETDRFFNRFDDKRLKLVRNLINIIYINIDNYRLKILSSIDKLTGTNTRKYFENEFNNILNESKRNQKSFGLLMIDIDNFKGVNDTFGHRTGDMVLSKIGNYLVNNIRKTDVVARYGGEEFVVLLNDVEEHNAVEIAEKIRRGVEQLKISNIDNPITISIGISMFPKHSQFNEELLIKADQALYSAKEQGKNRVEIWNNNLSNSLNRMDRLAGILTGNINIDQINILAMLDVINIVKSSISKEEKIFKFLGKVIETFEAEYCTLIEIGMDKKILNIYSRSRFSQDWITNPILNKAIIERTISNKKGEFLIDWENTNEIDMILNKPKWQSVITIPLIVNDEIRAVGYVTVSIKEKEFNYNSYNLAKVLFDIFSTAI